MLTSTLLALALAADPTPATVPTAPSQTSDVAVAQAINAFGLDLFGRLRAQPGNLFFSPASVAVALEMANAGAGHATAAQLDAALHLGALDREAAFSGYGDLLQAWNALPPNESTLAVISRAWGSDRETFLESYRQRLSTRLGASLEALSFAQPEAARKTINAWVSQATHGKIVDLLARGTIDRSSKLVLTNAAYFLGQWTYPFAPAATRDEPFHLDSGDSPAVPMMHLEQELRVASAGGVQVLEMAYGHGALAFDAFLPDDPKGLPAFEASLDAAQLDQLLHALGRLKAEVALPRFTLRSQLVLNPVLQALGITDAFGPKADFSGMTSGRGLQISAVVHEAFVETDEKGTQAAAATGVVLRSRLARRERIFVFRADHPFLFLIRDTRTGAVLFMGRVADPRP